jgi:hypothetical protein
VNENQNDELSTNSEGGVVLVLVAILAAVGLAVGNPTGDLANRLTIAAVVTGPLLVAGSVLIAAGKIVAAIKGG